MISASELAFSNVTRRTPTFLGMGMNGLLSLAGVWYLANLWKAFQIAKIDKTANNGRPDSVWSTLGAIFFPQYYSAFKISKYVPNGNSTSHTVGQLLVPGIYSSFQLANLRQQKLPESSNINFEKGLSLFITRWPYGAYAATTLANQASKFFPPKRPMHQMDTFGSQPLQLQIPLQQPVPQPISFVPAPQASVYAQATPYMASPFRMNY